MVLDACTDDTAGRWLQAAARTAAPGWRPARTGPRCGPRAPGRHGRGRRAAGAGWADRLHRCRFHGGARLGGGAARWPRRTGARAIGGRIEIAPAEMARLPPGVARDRCRRQRRRHRLVLADPGPPGSTSEHWQFSGASLAVTAEVYRHVGGMGPDRALEDEAFERALIAHGVPIHRPLAVRVTTSGRLVGVPNAGWRTTWRGPPAGASPVRIEGRVAQHAYDRTSEHATRS